MLDHRECTGNRHHTHTLAIGLYRRQSSWTSGVQVQVKVQCYCRVEAGQMRVFLPRNERCLMTPPTLVNDVIGVLASPNAATGRKSVCGNISGM